MVSRIIFAAIFVIVPIALLSWLMLKKPAKQIEENSNKDN